MIRYSNVAPLLFLIGTAVSAGAVSVPVPHGTVELISNQRAVAPGYPAMLGLHFRLEPGWHVYWKNPGDSGLPPQVRWELPNGVTAGDFEWPAPKRLTAGPLLDYGYEGEVLLPLPLTIANSLTGGDELTVKGKLRVLVCRETCIPGKADLMLALPVKRQAVPAVENARLFEAALAAAPKAAPSAWKLAGRAKDGKLVLNIAGLDKGAKVSFIPAEAGLIENAAPQESKPSANGTELTLKPAAEKKPAAGKLEGLLYVSAGTGDTVYAISAPLAAAAPTTLAGARKPIAQNAGDGLISVILLAFAGGLVLNLMPCVFPVLSIKALHLLESAGKNHRTIRLSAVAYTAGVLVSFWALVALLLALRSGGRHLGWGFQLQSPPFVAFLCCLLFILGLSLAGLFEIGQSLMGAGSGLAQREGYSGSFFTGVLATVVATPCTAPFMGAAIGFALSQPAVVCTMVFTSLALGLAAPFLLLALAPQLGRYLPRPGRWMETLKQVLAFPIFATIIWLLWVYGQQTDVNSIAALLTGLLAIALAGWIAGRWAASRLAIAIAAVLVLAAIGFTVTTASSARAAAATQPSSASGSGLAWEAFTRDKLKSYRASGKPVLIDFTAAWCLTCQVNDRVVFQSEEVKRKLGRSNIGLLRADWTSYDPAITETLAEFGRSAVPLYVYFGGGAQQPVILPDGLLRPSTLLSAIEAR